jgi:hypothetical protein
MFYLIFNERVVDQSAAQFPVCKDMQWVESKEAYTPYETSYINGEFIVDVVSQQTIDIASLPTMEDKIHALMLFATNGDNSDIKSLIDVHNAIASKYPGTINTIGKL